MELTFLENNLHHALLITHQKRKELTSELWEKLQATSLAHRLFDPTILDIDTVRSIISWARSSYDGERIGLISFHTAGTPAQNALLKILEEPPLNTRFIIITNDAVNIIDTVLSRLSLVHIETSESLEADNSTKLFLSTNPSQRMKLSCVTQLLEKKDEEDRKDREAVKAFILSLIPVLTSQKVPSRYITETLEIASYGSDTSSSGKALLEYLSLLLPQVKS